MLFLNLLFVIQITPACDISSDLLYINLSLLIFKQRRLIFMQSCPRHQMPGQISISSSGCWKNLVVFSALLKSQWCFVPDPDKLSPQQQRTEVWGGGKGRPHHHDYRCEHQLWANPAYGHIRPINAVG